MTTEKSIVPANIDAEINVLSACLLDDATAFAAVGMLEPGDFFRSAHQYVFRGITCLVKRGKPVDYLTLAELLEKEGCIEEAGGKVSLLKFSDNTFSLLHIEHHIEMIKRCAMQRKLILAARQIETMATSPQDDITEVRAEAIRLITEAVSEKESAEAK